MKKMMRYISVMVLLLCSIVASARGGVEVKVEIASLTNGTITSRMSGQTCTLTVTPAAGYYIRKSDITVQKTVSPSAAIRRGAEIPVTDNLTLKGDEPAAYSAECQYSFDIPEGYNALVTATFTECTAITPSVTLQGWTYGDAANEAEVTGNTGKATVSYSYAVKGGTSFAAAIPTDAGNYTVKVAIPAIGIYTAGEATGDFTITAAPVTITTGSASKTYDGTALTKAEANISGLVNNETATVTATGSQTEVGESVNTYTIDWGQTKKANYTVTEQLGKLTVTAASMTITADGYEGVYDGKTHGITLKNVPEGSTVTYATSQNGTYSETAPTFIDVCDATSVYYKVTNSNYNDASGSATVTITAAPVTITTGSATKTYDGTALTTPEANISGLVNNETATVTATGSQTEVGESVNTYTIDWGQTKKANYTVTEQLGKLTVTAATMTVSADGYEGVYDGQAHGITLKNVPEGSTVTYANSQNGTYSETAPTFTDVCDATSVYYKVTNSNYNDASGSATVTITAAPVTITTGSATKTYDGTALTTPEANISGLVNNETATVTATGSQTEVGESVNTYTIDWGQTKKANYTVTEQLGKLTVTAATMAVTADGYEGVYDGQAHGITLKNVPEGSTVTYANSQNGTYSETAPTFIDVCDATSVYYKVTKSNYTAASGSATVKITPKAVTVSGIEASISTENGVSTVIVDCSEASIVGVVGGQALTISGVTGTIKETATDGTVTVALDYSKAKLGGDHAKNYVLSATGNQPTVTVTNKKETSVDIAEDGTKTETKTESTTAISEDGSVTVTESTSQIVTDGQGKVTVTEANTVTETKTDGSTEMTSTVVEKDGNNNVTGKTETTKTDDAKGTTTENTVVKDGDDNVVGSKNVTVETADDGTVKSTESTYQSNNDGTTQETFEETITDEKGAFVESSMVVKETDADGSIIVNEVVAKAVGKDGELHTLYNPNTGEHFYTKNIDEARALVSAGWADETAGRQCEVGLSDDAINRARYEEKSSKITSATGQVQLEKSSKTLTVLKGTDDAKMSLKGAKAGENFRVTCSKGFMLGSNHQLKVKGALIGAPRRADRAPQLAEDEILIESGVEYEILTDEPLVLTLKTTESDVSIESIAISEATTGIRTMSDVRGKMSDVWYTLDGRELDKAPVAKGLYFHGGRKIVVR